ncbi:hypothetical protein [Neobacillus sp. PS2-9]|uniref:hypothetical protein n=1 Tax=Neobacillus sp. PS2-9 TaxID=3070676 RepID=UPI0027DF55FE|nr:hypothetical protein [Neobacillus sp. PS2-9]WML56251.1 hypothetical protein RCG25_15060 [Neobacillus sp. PS2-9]
MKSNDKYKISFIKTFVIMVILLLIVMNLTRPSNEKLDSWIKNEYGLQCNYKGLVGCIKDNKKIIHSSQLRNIGIFASYEVELDYENDKKTTIRILGVFGTIYKMKDGVLWEILN